MRPTCPSGVLPGFQKVTCAYLKALLAVKEGQLQDALAHQLTCMKEFNNVFNAAKTNWMLPALQVRPAVVSWARVAYTCTPGYTTARWCTLRTQPFGANPGEGTLAGTPGCLTWGCRHPTLCPAAPLPGHV